VISSPVIGDEAGIPSRVNALAGTPSRDRMASASSRIDAGWANDVFMIVL